MITSILTFEFVRRLSRISTYVYFVVFFGLGFLFVLMSGGAFAQASVDFGTGGKVLVTSPFALNLIIMFVSFFGVVVVAAISGQATYQDLDSNSTAFFYTAPITKFRPASTTGSPASLTRSWSSRRTAIRSSVRKRSATGSSWPRRLPS